LRKLTIIEFVTLDGVMQGFGSPDEDRDGGFDHGGWGAPYGDDVLGKWAVQGIAQTSAYLFGRRTYEKMVAFWPAQPSQNPMAASLNSTPKYVVTNSLTSLEWTGSHILAGDAVESTAKLKAEGEGRIAVLGSGVLVQTLIANGLIDDYLVLVHPLVVGTGKRLFRVLPHPIPLKLVECTPTTTGVLLLTYTAA
jgi:dihydrofolate reductase